MALRHILRLSPRLDGRWALGLLLVVGVVLAVRFIQWDEPAPPLDLVALGPDGGFADTLHVPVSWSDTATSTPDAVTRVPLILGVRNRGTRPARPARLALSLPVRYRLTGKGGDPLEVDIQPGSPLVTYSLETGFDPIEPGRLPALLPRHDTLWLEVVIPSFYCVVVGDSIPEFVPALPPPLSTLGDVRIFYSFEEGDLPQRRTGTLAVRIDTTALRVELPAAPPAFATENDPVAAQPPLGSLRRVGSRRTMCGEPGSPMELLSTVWETPGGGRFLTLDYGGKVRKRLYDLDGDGVIERESWDPAGQGEFTATRRARLPIPEFLLPVDPEGRYDLARLDSLSTDSLARLDPFREAMPGPGPLPALADSTGAARPRLPPRESIPEPTIDRGLLGRPVSLPPPDTGGG